MSFAHLTIFQWAGLALIGALLLQLLLGLFRQLKQTLVDRLWQDLTIKQLLLAEASIKQEKKSLAHGWNGLRKFKVASKVMECEDICTFYLSPHDRQPIPSYKPGQHITVNMQPHNQKKVVRCYSLSDCYGTENYYIITVKFLRGINGEPDGKGSGILHKDTNIDDLIDIKAPQGRFYLNQKSQKPVVLMGNGVGITPLLAMLNNLCEQQPERPVILFYGVRNSQHVVQLKHLKDCEKKYPAFSLILVNSRPLENEVLGEDYQYKGYVDSQMVIGHISSAKSFLELNSLQQFEFYICGTAEMMNENIEGLKAWGVPDKLINYEAFGPASIQKPKVKKQITSTEKYKVEFKQSGKTLDWNGEHENLLELGLSQSVPIDSGCCCGECGTCEVAIVSGTVCYPNNKPETDVAEGHCLMCIAAPSSPLVLDT